MWRLGTHYQAELKRPVLSVLIPLKKYEWNLIRPKLRFMSYLQITFLPSTWMQAPAFHAAPWWSETCNLPEEKLRPRLKRSYVQLSGYMCSFFCLPLCFPAHLRHQRSRKDEVQDLRRMEGMKGKKQSGEDVDDRWREHTLAWNQVLAHGEHAEGAEGLSSVWFLGLNQTFI